MSKNRMWPWVAISLAVVVCGGAVWVWRAYFDTYHYAVVREGVLYRDGARSFGQFSRAIGAAKAKTVVRLVDENEQAQETFSREAEHCKASGVRLIDIPIRLGGWPSSGQVRQFLAVATDNASQPVLVHCAQGVRRTAMMVAAYQESVLGYDKERAKAAILTFGHSDRTVNDIRRFIDRYDPGSQSVPDDLALGQE